MNKKKIGTIIAIVIVFVMINGVTYKLYAIPKIVALNSQKKDYDVKKKKADDLIIKKNSIEKIEDEISKLQDETKDIDQLVPYTVDTPQLIYGFYTACKKYNLVGKTISFEINSDTTGATSETGTADTTGTTGTTSTTDPTNAAANTTASTTASTTKDSKFTKLEIKLTVVGKSADLVKFLDNIDSITERRINVKNIKITAFVEENKDTAGTKTDTNLNSNAILKPSTIGSDLLNAEFDFYHYVQIDENQASKIKEYEFYDKPVGFKNISDMFKK